MPPLPRRSPSCSSVPRTRWATDLSPPSVGPAAISRASTYWSMRWSQSSLRCCTSWCPQRQRMALLENPTSTAAKFRLREFQEAARALRLDLRVLNASTAAELTSAFATLVEQRAGALVIASDPFFTSQRDQIVALAAHHALPAIASFREYTAAGGLMSYGISLRDAYRLAGTYTGRILKGEKPADLPVEQSTKVEFVINLKTAKTLGLTFPLPLLGRADEVIE
jgi:putative tryptophan/tyrosine transport system substrate-binding protein